MSRYKTPLRYPGGKQKLAPFISELIECNGLQGCNYVEPYAGGAGIAVDLLLSGSASKIHLNDASYPVYCFWKSVLNQSEEFCRKISRAVLSVKQWRQRQEILASPTEHDCLEVGFSMFYLNRCNRSGILKGGLIGGLSQLGEWRMDARFPRGELIRRIEVIAAARSRIRLRNWDAERFLKDYVPRLDDNTLIYCDPPYFNKADRLYLDYYTAEDHKRIAQVIQKSVSHRWVVSYDGAPEILKHYARRRSFLYGLQYNASSAYKGTEVFFFSDRTRVPSVSAIAYIDERLHSLARRSPRNIASADSVFGM